MPLSDASANSPLAGPPLPGQGSPWAVLLDIDGTLLEFADDPRTVFVAPSLLILLHDLHRALHGALALVSSRGLADIDRLFGPTQWAAAGLHGLELRHADGSFRRRNLKLTSQLRMRKAAGALAVQFGGLQLEDKQQVVVLYCRHDEEKLAALHAAAKGLLPHLPGYELQPGKQMLEFKPAGMDKGQAIRELLRHAPFIGCKPVYLGDDLTDEHAFVRVNRARGISVRVGDREPTLAHYTVAGPEAVENWLHHVLASLPSVLPTEKQPIQPS
ncbi:MAG: trehalose-phosphatase [Pseudomonadota bacterium]|nr:trehalose-phosphatase [Pseudomonadota bacterium]